MAFIFQFVNVVRSTIFWLSSMATNASQIVGAREMFVLILV